MNQMRPVWAEVNLTAIKRNVQEIRRILGTDIEIMAVVKANAYGHGAVEVSRVALEAGADRLGVAILEEGLELRENGIWSPILILGYVPPSQYELAIKENIAQTVFDLKHARDLARLAQKNKKKALIHLKIDTGMGRLGFIPGNRALNDVLEIASLKGVEIEGIYTHMAAADKADKSYSYHQLRNFNDFTARLAEKGLSVKLRHAANSASLIELPETRFNLVRPGITLYGLYPSSEVKRNVVELTPAMSFKAHISHVKKVPPGFSISYGCTYTTRRETIVATVPVGYADGYPRILSNCAEVLVCGRRVPVIGRVCMDQIMLDVTSVPFVEKGEEVVLFGSQGEEYISVDELAEKAKTINYELLCMVSSRVPRIYRGG